MARIRSVKPEFWDDRKLAQAVSRDGRLLYIGLWNFADEHARCNGDPVWLAGHIFPYESDIGPDEVARYLDELARCSRVWQYSIDGDPFLFLPKLADHQRLEPHKVASKHPDPPETAGQDVDPSATQVFSDQVARDAGLSERNDASLCCMEHVAGSMEQGAGRRRADKPAPHGTRIPEPFEITEPMKAWVREQGITPAQARASTDRFCDYWRGKPGKDGRKTDWTATWRNWLRRDHDPPANGSTTDARVAAALAVRDRYAAAEGREITA